MTRSPRKAVRMARNRPHTAAVTLFIVLYSAVLLTLAVLGVVHL
jgi:hypothetical protein